MKQHSNLFFKNFANLLLVTLTTFFPNLDANVEENNFCMSNKEELDYYHHSDETCQVYSNEGYQPRLYRGCSHWSSSIRFYTRGEYLYWKTNISDLKLNTGISTIIPGNESGLFMAQQLGIQPNFKWNSGYRIGAGMKFCNNITLEAIWTQYSNESHKSTFALDRVFYQGAKVCLQQIDVTIAYTYACSNIHLKPFLELRATKIKNNLKTYFSLDAFNDHQNFKGIGPSLGIYGDCCFSPGLGVYGEAAFSALYGNYRFNFEELDGNLSSCKHRHLHKYSPTLDLGIGLFSKTCICQCLDVGVKIGYEFHKYYNLSYLGYKRGDVTFSGCVASLEIAF